MKKKQHQLKSRWYYIFWGSATISVLLGQLYVGTGYRYMARTMLKVLNTIEVEIKQPYSY